MITAVCIHCDRLVKAPEDGSVWVHWTGKQRGLMRCHTEDSGLTYGYNAHPVGSKCAYPCLGEGKTCDMESVARSWMRTFYCSLPPGHKTPHRAYWGHEIHDDKIAWLGPWMDDSEWDDDEAKRLHEHWRNMDSIQGERY